MTDQFGTEPHKLHRIESPGTSVDAAYSVDTTRLEREVYGAIKAHGEHGAIQDDVLQRFPADTPYSSITARFSALDRKGFITRGPDKRKGRSGRSQMVMRVIEEN